MDARNIKNLLQQLFDEFHAGNIEWKEFEQRLAVLKQLRDFIGDPLLDFKEFEDASPPPVKGSSDKHFRGDTHNLTPIPESPTKNDTRGIPGGRAARRATDDDEWQQDTSTGDSRRQQTKSLFQVQPVAPKAGTASYLNPRATGHQGVGTRPHSSGHETGNEPWHPPMETSTGRHFDPNGSGIVHPPTAGYQSGITHPSTYHHSPHADRRPSPQQTFEPAQPPQYPYIPQTHQYPPKTVSTKAYLLVGLGFLILSFVGGIFLSQFDQVTKLLDKPLNIGKNNTIDSSSTSDLQSSAMTEAGLESSGVPSVASSSGSPPSAEDVSFDTDPHKETLEKDPGSGSDSYPFVLPYELPKVVMLAERGDILAQRQLGEAYFFGKVLAINNDEAVRYFKLAAAQGDLSSIYHLGRCYEMGLGVPQDTKQAIENFRIAASRGNINSQCRLGYLNEKGIDGKPDIEEAKLWYRKAEKRGSKKAQAALERLEKTHKSQGPPRNQ